MHQLAPVRGPGTALASEPTPSTAPGASACGYDWVKRKLRTGAAISPSSISQTPLRVSPVTASVRGSSTRVYQKSVTSSPRRIATSAATRVGRRAVDRRPAPARAPGRRQAAAPAPRRRASTGVPGRLGARPRPRCGGRASTATADARPRRASSRCAACPRRRTAAGRRPPAGRRQMRTRRVELLLARAARTTCRSSTALPLKPVHEQDAAGCRRPRSARARPRSARAAARPGRRRPAPWPPPGRRAPRRRGRPRRTGAVPGHAVGAAAAGRCRPSPHSARRAGDRLAGGVGERAGPHRRAAVPGRLQPAGGVDERRAPRAARSAGVASAVASSAVAGAGERRPAGPARARPGPAGAAGPRRRRARPAPRRPSASVTVGATPAAVRPSTVQPQPDRRGPRRRSGGSTSWRTGSAPARVRGRP